MPPTEPKAGAPPSDTGSLRRRLLRGAAWSTAGIVVVSHLIVRHLIRRFPDAPEIAHVGALLAVAVFFVGAALWQVRRTLRPLDTLRDRLGAVRRGEAARLTGSYPHEIEPLVADLNALLEERERSVARALTTAGDLAHALKTPLTLLAQEAEQARGLGLGAGAERIGDQIAQMRGQIDRHLARTRAHASAPVVGGPVGVTERTPVLPVAQGLVRTLDRLHAHRAPDARSALGVANGPAGRSLLELAVDSTHLVQMPAADLEELLGNLLDNACQWARGRVRLTSGRRGDTVELTIDDDGPGLSPALREVVQQRGVRADEAGPGSGFGLAIANDLATLYGGELSLESSPLGGLRVRVGLPGAPAKAGS